MANGDEDLAEQPYEGSTVAEFLVLLSVKLGEKIEPAGSCGTRPPTACSTATSTSRTTAAPSACSSSWAGSTPTSGRATVAHDIALHIASAAPAYITREDVPADVVAKEREVLEALSRNEGKPEQALPKIIEGRLNGFYKDVAPARAGVRREPKTTIKQLVADLGPDATVRRFARVKIGEE